MCEGTNPNKKGKKDGIVFSTEWEDRFVLGGHRVRERDGKQSSRNEIGYEKRG